jgi:hypothetical protein
MGWHSEFCLEKGLEANIQMLAGEVGPEISKRWWHGFTCLLCVTNGKPTLKFSPS